MKRLTLLVCLVAIPIAIFANAHEPYQGDFDLDGDVDFEDFLTFASNYGKTGGSTTPINRVDTVRVVVRDTIYIDSGSGGNTGTQTDSLSIPRNLAQLKLSSSKIPTGISIWVTYHDLFGSMIQGVDEIWRNPDKITVTIRRGNTELYSSTGLPFQRSLVVGSGIQLGIDVLIPKSEISDIYADWSSSYTIRVVIEFDGVPYSGES